MGSALPLYISSLPIPPPLSQSPSPIESPPPYHNMSQINLHEIIRQQQEQLVAIQAQIQALLVVQGGQYKEEQWDLVWDLTWKWQNQPFSMEKQKKWGVLLQHTDSI